MNNFKETLKENIIPRIQAMIVKEKEYLQFLLRYKHKFLVKDFIQTSQDNLNHLEQRCQEYIDYLGKI